MVGGASISPYLPAFKTDLFLSANEADVQEAIDANIASGIICDHSNLPINAADDINQIRIAFDGDAVIFSDESERIYQTEGLQAFVNRTGNSNYCCSNYLFFLHEKACIIQVFCVL